MNLTTFIPLASSIFVLVLGVFVLVKDKKSKINRILFFFTIGCFFWFFGTFMLFKSEAEAAVLYWDKFIYTGVVFLPALSFHFVSVFIGKEKHRKFYIWLGYFLGLFFLVILATTDLFLNGVYDYSWGKHSKAQLFHHIFLIYFVVYIFFLFKTIIGFYRKAQGVKREQSRYIIVAFIALGVGITALISAYGVDIRFIAYIAYLSGFVFALILAYAIIRHRLFDIRMVLRKSSVYLFTIFWVILFVFIGQAIFEKIIINKDALFWINAGILALAILIFPFIRDYFYKISNRYFFSSLYDSGDVIKKISEGLSSTLELNRIYEIIYEAYSGAFHLKKFGVLVKTKEEKHIEFFKLDFNQGFPVQLGKTFQSTRKLDQDLSSYYAKTGGKIIITEELKNDEGVDSPEINTLVELLEEIGVELLAPLSIKDKEIGYLALGSKESGDMFNSEDLGILKLTGSQMAIALENARLYEEVKELNRELEKKVKERTRELQDANKELKDMNQKLAEAYDKLHKLDRAKSEFLSIASHQLRTPLTSIKGFTSLLLEGTYGKISEDVRETLEKVFVSNERLIKLVEDLLNISRIESGRIAFDFKENKIEDVANEVLESMRLSAKARKLKLELRLPKKAIKPFYFDKSKIREVISNFVDNSVKYTKKGTVAIEVKEIGKKVQVSVVDTGIGIAKGETSYIFDKFQRGKDVSKIHTEGVGLGLYVCKKIIEAHDGKIWAESDGIDKGSRFIFELDKKNGPMPEEYGKIKKNSQS